MKKLTGKTHSILKRLPHFFHEADGDDLFARMTDIFGKRLQKAEEDLYKVLHSHHVETADNEGSKGYIAPNDQRGDLDKIFALYLEVLGGTSQLVKLSPYFTLRSLNTRALAKKLIEDESEIILYLNNSISEDFPEFQDLLKRYYVDNCKFTIKDFGPWFVKNLTKDRSHKEEKSPVTVYIKEKLLEDKEIVSLMDSYGGGDEVSPLLINKLVEKFNNNLLLDPSLFKSNYEHFISHELPEEAWLLINSVYNDFLYDKYSTIVDEQRRDNLLNVLKNAEPAEFPPGDDLIRLNSILLTEEYKYYEYNNEGSGFYSKNIPSLTEVRSKLIDVLNHILNREDLFNKEQFPEMEEDYDFIIKEHGESIEWVNRILLESIFSFEIEKSYIPYRERMRGLIRVLLEGASTRQGITDIVAANLGILGNDSRSLAAKSMIDIEEYDPDEKIFFKGILRINEVFNIYNPNPLKEKPEIKISILKGLSYGISKIGLINMITGEELSYEGDIKRGYSIIFKDNAVYVGERKKALCEIPSLESGYSQWKFEIWAFDENGESRPVGLFDKGSIFGGFVFGMDEPLVRIELSSNVYTPGSFTAIIPWHIEGFTDQFEETEDHPRHLILPLINRVKSAGVRAYVSYKINFNEKHNIEDKISLVVDGELLHQTHSLDEKFEIDSRHGSEEVHEQQDSLTLCGVFDYTKLDSVNTFK